MINIVLLPYLLVANNHISLKNDNMSVSKSLMIMSRIAFHIIPHVYTLVIDQLDQASYLFITTCLYKLIFLYNFIYIYTHVCISLYCYLWITICLCYCILLHIATSVYLSNGSTEMLLKYNNMF